MNLTINTEALLGRLSKMVKIIPKKVTLPHHGCVLVKIKEGEATIAINNGMIQIVTSVLISCDTDFEFCAPWELFFKTLQLIGEREVEISKDKKKPFGIEIKVGRKKYKIACEDPVLFPIMRPLQTEGYMIIDSQTLKDALNISGKFVNPKSQVDALKGVNISIKDSKCVLFSTDSFSLARLQFQIDSYQTWSDLILPYEICPVLPELMMQTEQVTVNQDGKMIQFEGKDYNIQCVLINAKYPDCEQFFSKNRGTKINIDRAEVEQALKVLRLYTPETTNVLVCDLNPSRLVLYAEDDAKDNTGAQAVNITSNEVIEAVKAGFNIDFFINTMNSLTTSEVTMWIDKDPRKPAFLSPNFDTDPVIDSMFLLMPMTIN